MQRYGQILRRHLHFISHSGADSGFLSCGVVCVAVGVQVSGGVSAQLLSFSSYPGELFSDDDLYITSSNMVVLETTNHIYNLTILEVSKATSANSPALLEHCYLWG